MSFLFSRRSFCVNRKPFNRAPGYEINLSLLAKTLLSVPSKKKKPRPTLSTGKRFTSGRQQCHNQGEVY